jgi:integrase/recombinase XerC
VPAPVLDHLDDLGPDDRAQDRLPLLWDTGAPANRRALGQHLVQAWLAGVVPEVRLMTPGEIHTFALRCRDLDEEIALIGSQLPAVFGGTDESCRRMLTEIARFVERLRFERVGGIAEITEQHAHDFIHEAVMRGDVPGSPGVGTQHTRRVAVRLVIKTARHLHLVDSGFDPTVDITLPPRSSLASRPLTDDEELLGRSAATGTLTPTRRAAAWALGQASAVAGEQLTATIGDLRLDEGRVWLHGTRKRQDRWGILTEWGIEQLALRVKMLVADGGTPNSPLIRGKNASRRSGQTQSCNAISEVLKLASLDREHGVSPASLANWRGRQIFDDTGRIEEAARALGIGSLDSTAAAIGHEWQ